MGVTQIDNILMILGVSLQMKENEREIITKELMKGFNSKAIEAGTQVTGGQSVMNPWPMIGGTAISVVDRSEVIFPNYAEPGDYLILTKPLGTQVIVNTVQWLIEKNENWNKAKLIFTEEELWDTFTKAENSMSTLNKRAAQTMKKYKIGACTDITGFGIKGHLENLAIAQKKGLKFIVNKLPIYNKADLINQNVHNFKLIKGYSAETSGGLLISLNKEDAVKYVNEMNKDNECVWILGYVEEGQREVEIKEKPEIIYI